MSTSIHRRSIAPALLSTAVAFALYGPSVLRAQSTPAPDAAALAQAAAAQVEDDPNTPQREDAETLDEVVVTYRASLERALDKKRESIGQIDAIIAEDIGKFPDLNLAESLQRIPGVSISRDAGEGRNISVRGLGPDFTRVRINGMEALTTAGGTDSSGGANRGRGFDFNVFASDLFNSLTVRKTASADVEEGSLGATVDLDTARPFDYDGFTFVTSAQAGYNDLSEDTDPRGAMLISNTFADGRIGALLSVAYTKRNLIEEGHSTVRWDNGASSGGFSPDSPFADALLPSTFHPRIPRYGILGHEQERLGVTASLQFEPTDTTLITFDGLYADFDATRSEDFLEAISFSRTGANGKPATVVRDGVVDANGNLVYGVFDNVDVRSESRYDELATTFKQFSLDVEQEMSDTFRLNALFGASESELDNPIQTTITLDRADTDGVIWDYRGDDRLPLIDYGFDVTNPANWEFANGLSEIRLRPQTATNKFETAGFDGEWDFSDALRFKGGVLWKKYTFESTERRRASETAVPGLPDGMTLADLTRFVSLYGTDVPAGTDTGWVIPDIDAFNDLLRIYSNEGAFALSDAVASVRGNNRSVIEESMGLFLQADFEMDLGAIPIAGNIGVRQVETEQTSTGFALVAGSPVLTTIERDYDDTLPSLNLTAQITDDFLIRFGAAKVMARPGLGNLTPGVTVNVSGGARTVNGGNPALDPFRAKTADLAFEWYYADEALLGIALFYKDIESFVQTSRETRPFSSSGLPASLLEGTGATVNDDFQFNIPLNTPGGELKGFEASWQTPFTFLPVDGFGAILNYTWVDSKIQYLTAAGAASLNTDLVGLSKNAYNATLYYENERFGARVSAAYRDDYLTTVPGRNNNDVEGTKNTLNVDLSASYRLNDNFELTFEGLNLTDEYNDQWVSSTGDRVNVYHHTGRQYMLGFRYKY
ncbi:TonB-dependent receptor [Chiayiivirga flava]|uniref:TonB-dependent receptor n=1 Tax=Chiayiivirga flava TaxID=659595 RepID=A0A7W8G118_9GAMM|nr:TonB-dependent receptor [Chiayiivirga flava]